MRGAADWQYNWCQEPTGMTNDFYFLPRPSTICRCVPCAVAVRGRVHLGRAYRSRYRRDDQAGAAGLDQGHKGWLNLGIGRPTGRRAARLEASCTDDGTLGHDGAPGRAEPGTLEAWSLSGIRPKRSKTSANMGFPLLKPPPCLAISSASQPPTRITPLRNIDILRSGFRIEVAC